MQNLNKAAKFLEKHSEEMHILVVNKVALGKAMRKLRIEKGISLRKMAGYLGFSAPYLSDCELGRRQLKQADLEKFLEKCGV